MHIIIQPNNDLYMICLFIPDILFFQDDSNNPTPHVVPI